MMFSPLLAVSVILLLAKCIVAPAITVPLSSVNAMLYSPVEFICEGHGGDLGWVINGDSITDTTKQERAITSITTNTSNTIISSVLTIIALPINDGIIMSCFIGTDVLNLAYSSAVLTIRGISPVENISLDLNSSTLYWSPPSSIPSQYQPLLSYIVNITTGINDKEIVFATNITSIQIALYKICGIFTVTIIVFCNSNYMYSNVSSIMEFIHLQVYSYNNSKIFPTPLITYNRINDIFDVTFTIKVFGYVCDNTTITGITRVINTNENTLYKHQSIYIDGVDGSVTVNYTIHLNSSMSYTFIALINNSIGNINDESDSVYFTTYHVQDVSVYQVDDSVRAECIFVYQSIADGCHIKLTTDGSIIQSFNIYLNESNIASQYITLSVNGIYSITVYDIFNGIITDTPSVHYDDIFQYISLTDSSDITTTPTSTTTSDTPTSQLLPSNIHPSNDTSTTDDVIPVIAGSTIGGVFIILIVISIMAIGSCTIITKRNKKKLSVAFNAERAIVRLPHSNNNQYSEVVLPPVTIQPSSVVYTSNDDNPYHIPIDEFIPNGRGPHGDVSPYHNYCHEFITIGSVSAASTVGSNGQVQHNESSSFPHDHNEGGASIPASAGTTIHGVSHHGVR